MKEQKNIYLMYTLAFLQGMVFYGPVSTLYRQAQGLSVFQITLIESISLLLSLALEIPWGIIADRIGYKRTMIFCGALFFISKLVFWMARGFCWFLLERVLLSVVVSGMSGVDMSILYLSCKEGESQKAFSIYNGLSVAGLLIASMIFSVFVGDDLKTAEFLTVLSYGVAAAVPVFLIEVKERETGGGERRGERREKRILPFLGFKTAFLRIVKNRPLLLFLVSVAFLTQTHQTVTVFLAQVQYERCGLSPSAIGYIYAAVTLAGFLGVFSDRSTRKIGIKMAGIVLQVVAILSCVGLAYTDSAAVSVCGVMALHVADSLFQPLQMELQNRQVSTEDRATELSIYAMIIDSIGVGTSLLFGALATVSLSLAFLLGMGLCTVGAYLFLTSL